MRTKQLVFLIGMMLLLSVGVKATVTVNGLWYTLSGSTSTVIGFDNLTATVVIPESVTFEGREYMVVAIGEYAFGNCSNLTSVTFPSGLTSIEGSAFYGCSSLTSVTFPSGLTSIGESAFCGCHSLISVTFPASLTSIGTFSFGNCRALTELIVSTDNTAFSSIDGVLFNKEGTTLISYLAAKQSTYTIPYGVTSIGEYAFSSFIGLTSITFPSSLISIGMGAFSRCDGLTSVTLPSSLTSIGADAFSHCIGLTEFIVSADNTAFSSIDGVLFNKEGTILIYYANAKKQSTYTIPNSVISIGGAAFSFCRSLTSITFPSGLISIESAAFYDCRGLTSITFPSGLVSIESAAFNNCRGLTSITFPSGLVSVGERAFSYCDGLMSVRCVALVPPSISGDTFDKEVNAKHLYVPVGSKNAYMAAEHWKNFKNIIEEAGLGINELPQINLISYADGVLTFFDSEAPATVEVYTIEGKQIAFYQVTGGSCDLNALVSGVYIIKLSADGKVTSRKIIK